MTKYKFIKQVLKAGFHQPVRDKEGDYKIIISAKNIDGDYRISGWYDTLEKCKKNIGKSYGYDDLEEICQNWEILEPYFPIPEEALPIGSFVKIKGDAKEICKKKEYYGWCDNMKGMIGKTYKIEKSDLRDIKINDWWFPLQAITPIMEEDDDDDEKKLLEALKKKGWKIKGECLVK